MPLLAHGSRENPRLAAAVYTLGQESFLGLANNQAESQNSPSCRRTLSYGADGAESEDMRSRAFCTPPREKELISYIYVAAEIFSWPASPRSPRLLRNARNFVKKIYFRELYEIFAVGLRVPPNIYGDYASFSEFYFARITTQLRSSLTWCDSRVDREFVYRARGSCPSRRRLPPMRDCTSSLGALYTDLGFHFSSLE